MEFNYSQLRGKIVSQYGTYKAFCEALGMNPANFSKKLVHGVFNAAEIVKISELLSIPQEEIGSYFFDCEVKKSEPFLNVYPFNL